MWVFDLILENLKSSRLLAFLYYLDLSQSSEKTIWKGVHSEQPPWIAEIRPSAHTVTSLRSILTFPSKNFLNNFQVFSHDRETFSQAATGL